MLNFYPVPKRNETYVTIPEVYEGREGGIIIFRLCLQAWHIMKEKRQGVRNKWIIAVLPCLARLE